jgi:tRNA(adenine34) deaminase
MLKPPEHDDFMREAIAMARSALHLGEVPIGAVVVHSGEVVSRGFNQPVRRIDPSAHAEIIALQGAARALGNYRLGGTTLYVTAEPCVMCAGALVNARVARVVYGVAEPKWGALGSLLSVQDLPLNHHLEVISGILEDECRRLLQDFFKFRREERH